MSRPVLPIRSGCEQRCEGDGRACGVWRIKLASDWGRSEASRVDNQSDGDRMSDNRSTEETWPWT